MITTLQRTTVASFALALIIIISASNFAFAAPSTTSTKSSTGLNHKYAELMNVSDIIFYAPRPAKIEFTETSTEATPKPEPEPEPEPVLEETYKYYEEPNYSSYNNYSYTPQSNTTNGEYVTAADFQQLGVLHDGTWSYTYYSERVLPGTGLEIPGRHTDEDGYVCDGDGNVCVASDDLPKGTVVTLPIGEDGKTGVVYDTGSGYGNLDIYTSW